MQQTGEFYILHFNDVYDIEDQSKEPKAGAARFLTLLNTLQNHYKGNQITLFSGDVFGPSQLSTIYKGQQMVYPMQTFKIDVSCLGNHDLDFHLDHITDLIRQTNSLWIVSNIFDTQTKKPIAEVQEYQILEVPINHNQNLRIGIIGLAEEEWIGQITEIPQSRMAFEDFLPCADRLSKLLREKHLCQFIIALTHMRVPNDHKLINQLPPGQIDLVLGGHDHIWVNEQVSQSFYLKSGTNFKNLSLIKISVGEIQNKNWISEVHHLIEGISVGELHKDGYSVIEKVSQYHLQNPISKLELYIELQPFNILECIKKDQKMESFVQEKIEKYNQETLKTLCFLSVPLDTRFKLIRLNETEIVNFYVDLIRAEFQTEIGLINSGSIRSDEYFEVGPLTYQNINKIFALADTLLSFKMSGKNLHYTLENGVSRYPNYDGRFLGVSGIQFTFDPNQPPYQRILKDDIYVNQEKLDYERIYSVGASHFIASGFENYISIPDEDFLIDDTLAVQWIHLIVQFFELSRENEEIISLIQKTPNIQSLDPQKIETCEEKFHRFKHLIHEIKIQDNIPYIAIAPKLEKRIMKK